MHYHYESLRRPRRRAIRRHPVVRGPDGPIAVHRGTTQRMDLSS